MGANRASLTHDIAARVAELKRLDEELKTGRGYTSGRSGMLAYKIPDNDDYDLMKITNGGPEFEDVIFTLAATGSMATGKQFEIESTYTTENQDYPVASPFLEVWANGQKMQFDATKGTFYAGNGTTWNIFYGTDQLADATDWNTAGSQKWQTFVNYFSTTTITIQMKMRINSTDKGSLENKVTVL